MDARNILVCYTSIIAVLFNLNADCIQVLVVGVVLLCCLYDVSGLVGIASH